MRNKATSVINVIPPTTDYPLGRIKNNDGTGNGTPIVEELYGDMIEFFTKLFSLSGITMNDIPDNETNGYQSIQALYEFASKHNIVKDCEISGDTMTVNSEIANMQEGQFLIQRFVTSNSSGGQPTAGVNKIKKSTDSSTSPLHFPENYLYLSNLVIIEKTNSGFTCSTLAEGRVLNGLRNYIYQLQNRPTESVITLSNRTITTNIDSFSFSSTEYIMQNLLSWEIVWERYATEGANTVTFKESNKNINLTSGQAIEMLLFNSNTSGGFIRFSNMQGTSLNNVKLILKYKPTPTIQV